MDEDNITKRLPNNDPMRKVIRNYMASHPEEYDLSIHPDRGIPSEKHKNLLRAIDFAVLSHRSMFVRDYEPQDIYQLMNEEQAQRK